MVGEKRDRDSAKITFGFGSNSGKKKRTESKVELDNSDDESGSGPKVQEITSISGNTIIGDSVPSTKDEEPLIIPLPSTKNVKKDLMAAKIARGEVNMEEELTTQQTYTTTDDDIIMGEATQDLPLLLRNRQLELDSVADENERFRMDVESRPDSASLEQYETITVEKFGEALLRGMGWKPGMQVGLNGRGLAKPHELIPRPRGLGLGALPSQKDKEQQKKEEKAERSRAMKSDSKNQSRTKDPPLREEQEKRSSNSSRSESNRSRKSSPPPRDDTWLRPGITVRVISKKLEKGKLYCKRVQILDVISRTRCSILSDGSVVEDVRESMLETALPKAGGNVIVVSGRNKGRKGTLQERNSKKDRVIVQHEDDNSVGYYRFEQVSECNA